MRVRSVAVAVLLPLAVAGCSRSLDTGGLEQDLTVELEREFDATGVTVDCPDDVEVARGVTFRCEVTDPSGTTVAITVTQIDDSGRVSWDLTGGST